MNYWIFQATPRTFLIDYFLDDYVKQNRDMRDCWLVEKRFARKIADGDIAYIWKAKSEPSLCLVSDYYKWKERTGTTKKMARLR